MDRSKLADLSEIVSSVAIVVTLIYLTVEVRQNTDATRAQTAQAILQSAQSELRDLIEHPDIALSIQKKGPLTVEENVKLDAYLANAMRGREFAWIQFQNKTIDESNWNGELAVTRVLLDSSRIRDWWNKLGCHYMSDDFVQFVDQLIEAEPATDELWTRATNWSSE